jgi:hypothetical protein
MKRLRAWAKGPRASLAASDRPSTNAAIRPLARRCASDQRMIYTYAVWRWTHAYWLRLPRPSPCRSTAAGTSARTLLTSWERWLLACVPYSSRAPGHRDPSHDEPRHRASLHPEAESDSGKTQSVGTSERGTRATNLAQSRKCNSRTYFSHSLRNASGSSSSRMERRVL